MISKCDVERAAQARYVEHSEEEQNSVDQSAAQVFYRHRAEHGVFEAFCRHKADGTVLSKRFEGTEPTVRYFRSVLEAPSVWYGVF